MPQVAVFRIENRQLLLHFHLHRHRRNVGRLQLTSATMNNYGITAEGNIGFALILLLNPALQKLLSLSFTMDNKDFSRFWVLEIANPIHKLIGIGMGRKTIHDLNLCLNCHFLAHDPHALDAFDQTTAQTAFCLVAHKENRRFRPPEIVFQMMQDAPGIRHARCRNDNRRTFGAVECP